MNNNINDKQIFALFWSAWYIRVIHVHRRENTDGDRDGDTDTLN